MILINYRIQDGEHEYGVWDYETKYTEEDYKTGKVSDFNLLQETYGVDEDNLEEGTNMYWIGDSLVWVDRVRNITQEKLDIIREYV